MNMQSLIDRSKISFEEDPKNLPCLQDTSPLVSVTPSSQLILKPIWESSKNDIEGNLYREYIAAHPMYNSLMLRREVASRLDKASQTLPEHLSLVLRAGHRPLAVQREELRLNAEHFQMANKEESYESAIKHARIFIDDPDIKIPSHCCGSAVDVEVLDLTNNTLLDFGCPINTTSPAAYLHTDELNFDQKNNRLILLTAMLSAGFAPTFVEWWHFSYGDTVWAYFYDQPQSLYGIIEPAL